jgi:hypothetical protein
MTPVRVVHLRRVLPLIAVAATALSVPLPQGAAAAAAARGAAVAKLPIAGLIDRQGVPPATALSYVRGYVVKVDWADLQPTPGGPITPGNAIDKAIARVSRADLAGKVALKVRVQAGIGAPDWAKRIGGDPLPYENNQDGSVTGGTIGRFWLPEFGAAYAALQAELAAKYDAVPQIREVTVSACSTIFDELFVRQPIPSNVATLRAAGYTVAADQQCIRSAIAAHQVWQRTTSDVSFSPFPDVFDGGALDVGFTLSTMDYCRQVLGALCGLENNGLSLRRLGVPEFQTMYQRMADLGAPVTFQTAARGRIGDWTVALAAAVRYGARSVELPKGYTRWDQAQLASFGAQLEANG